MESRLGRMITTTSGFIQEFLPGIKRRRELVIVRNSLERAWTEFGGESGEDVSIEQVEQILRLELQLAQLEGTDRDAIELLRQAQRLDLRNGCNAAIKWLTYQQHVNLAEMWSSGLDVYALALNTGQLGMQGSLKRTEEYKRRALACETAIPLFY